MSSTQCLNSFSSSSFALAVTIPKYFFFNASSLPSCFRSRHPLFFFASLYTSPLLPASTPMFTSFTNCSRSCVTRPWNPVASSSIYHQMHATTPTSSNARPMNSVCSDSAVCRKRSALKSSAASAVLFCRDAWEARSSSQPAWKESMSFWMEWMRLACSCTRMSQNKWRFLI